MCHWGNTALIKFGRKFSLEKAFAHSIKRKKIKGRKGEEFHRKLKGEFGR